MRILNAYFENFWGIYEGMGRHTLYLDFEKDYKGNTIKPNKFVLLSGKNMSGKTTLGSILQPFKESFDDRRELILEGKTGKKVLHIKSGDDIYKTTCDYGKTITRCYVEKNGEELNPGGLIKSYEAILEQEIGITPDFFKIGRIGSNVTNFVDFSTAERKKYISKFLPDIAKYLDAFANIKDKYSNINSNIKFITSQIGKYDNIENLKDTESQIKTRQSDVLNGKENILKSVGGVSSDILKFKDRPFEELSKMVKEGEKLSATVEVMGKALEEFNSKHERNPSISELSETITSLKLSKSEISSEMTTVINDIARLTSDRLDKSNQIQKLNLRLNLISKSGSVKEIEDRLTKINSEIKDIEESLSGNDYVGIVNRDNIDDAKIGNVETSKINNAVYEVKLFVDYLIENAPTLNIVYGDDGESILYIIQHNQNKFKDDLTYLQNHKKTLTDKANASKEKITALTANSEQIEILKKRPSNCTINTCPFIENALKFEDLPQQINDETFTLSSINAEIKEVDDLISGREICIRLRDEYNSIVNKMSEYAQELLRFIFIEETNSEIIPVSKETILYAEGLSKVRDVCVKKIPTLMSEISQLKSKVTNKNVLELSLKSAINEAENIKNIEEDLTALREEIVTIDSELSVKNLRQTELSDILKSKEQEIQEHEEFQTAKINYKAKKDELQEKIETLTSLNNDNIRYKELLEENKSLEKILATTNAELSEIEKTLSKLSTDIQNVTDFEIKKKEFTEEINDLSILKEALDPNKGIPLLFIQSYLEKTKLIANMLLDIAFKGMFEIDFQIDVSDFYIRVNTDKGIKSDIKEGSQGQVALATIAISMALMEQSIHGYNILFLDEMDGPLDVENRSKFIDILQLQVEKLGIEQVFIISHNNAFDTCNLDLILLKNSDVNIKDEAYMHGKNIIFKI